MALDPNIKSEIINIGPDEGTITVVELAELVAKECGMHKDVTWPPIHMSDRPREVKHASCTADKARKLLNYETKTDLKKAIQETVAYVRKKGPKPFDYTYPLEIISDKTPRTWKDRLM
jgi:UDP-glucose 4-epimerase